MAKINEDLAGLIKDQTAPKIVATVDKDGVPNLTPKASLMVVDNDTLAFADLYGGKSRTITNLEETRQAAILVLKIPMEPPFNAYQIKGKYAGYDTTGPVFEQFARVIKEAIGADITGVASIKVEAVYSQSPQDAGRKID